MGNLVKGSAHQDLVRAIMGANFFGADEWSTFYGVQFTKKQLRKIDEFPRGEDVLNGPCPFNPGKAIHETHFAFLGLPKLNGVPFTMTKWNELHPVTGQPHFFLGDTHWYPNEEFVNDVTCEFRWYLMLAEIVPDSTGRTPDWQTEMLPAEYEVPTANAEVTKNFTYFKKNGVYLNGSRWARTKEMTSHRYFSMVGLFNPRGLCVSFHNGLPDRIIGVGASLKIPS